MKSTSSILLACLIIPAANASKVKPTYCGSNEVLGFVSDCLPEKTCSNRFDVIKYPWLPSPYTYKCVCAPGYYRNAIGRCITGEQCEAKPTCGQNEVQQCVLDCPPEKTCRNRDIAYACALQLTPCTVKCVCAPGFYRNSVGECITERQCDKCNKPNEFYSCGGPCDNECRTLDYQNRTNCPIINIKCNEKCYCDDGYARDNFGRCIPVDKCNVAQTCGPNEVKRCVQDCPPEKTCRNRDIEYACTLQIKPCAVKCVCVPGFYRNSIGECITERQCDKCNKPNEFYSCGGACDNECRTLDYQNRTNCPIINIKCNEKCYCDDGYARDDFGRCIPVDQCRKTCGDPNEELTCSKSCSPDLCISLVALFKCNSYETCRYRYRCKPGYLREREGSPCIPTSQCPQFG